MEKLKSEKINPVLVIYCATDKGAVKSEVVEQLLRYFVDKKVLVCYVITNMYSMTSSQSRAAQWNTGLAIMRKITDSVRYPFKETKFSGNMKDDTMMAENKFGIVIFVNSTKFHATFSNQEITEDVFGIDELFTYIVNNLSKQNTQKFFLITLHNRDYFCKIWHNFHHFMEQLFC